MIKFAEFLTPSFAHPILLLALCLIECQTDMSDFALDARLLKLLRAVVEEHVKTAQPVGSQALVEHHGLDVSSATVRNWFAELEAAGYLAQPHTSGGRIPTESGYRLYVRSMSGGKVLSKKAQEALKTAARASDEPTIRMKQLARVLAEMLELAVFVRFAPFDSYYTGLSSLFSQPEFHDWQRVVSLSEVLDRLDEALPMLVPPKTSDPVVLVGTESPFGPVCATVYIERSGVLIGILGPLRLDYGRAIEALQIISSLVS